MGNETTLTDGELTEHERVKCTAKWLTALYRAWLLKEEVKIPCAKCVHFEKKCSKNDPNYRQTLKFWNSLLVRERGGDRS